MKTNFTADRAAALLGCSKRSFLRWVKAWQEKGNKAFVHGNTGNTPHNKFPAAFRRTLNELVEQKYADVPACLAADLLSALDGITVSAATVRRCRQQQRSNGSKRQPQLHPLRRRRAQFGELIQIDGSPHQWFVDDPQLYTLLLFVDDATGRVTAARFERSESFAGYARLLEEHVWRFGIPVAFYSDRHSIFTAETEGKKLAQKKPELTQ